MSVRWNTVHTIPMMTASGYKTFFLWTDGSSPDSVPFYNPKGCMVQVTPFGHALHPISIPSSDSSTSVIAYTTLKYTRLSDTYCTVCI